MKKLSFTEMVQKLQKRFEGIELFDYIECDKTYKPQFSIWIKKGYLIPYTKKDTNTIFYNGVPQNPKLYDFEVYIKFDKFCQRYGWYASTESYTLQLFKL